jgi:hypothetical protein
MVPAWVAQKRLKCDILRLFTMSLFENIYGNYRLMTPNRKRLFNPFLLAEKKSFVIDVCLVNLLVESTRRKSHTAHL